MGGAGAFSQLRRLGPIRPQIHHTTAPDIAWPTARIQNIDIHTVTVNLKHTSGSAWVRSSLVSIVIRYRPPGMVLGRILRYKDLEPAREFCRITRSNTVSAATWRPGAARPSAQVAKPQRLSTYWKDVSHACRRRTHSSSRSRQGQSSRPSNSYSRKSVLELTKIVSSPKPGWRWSRRNRRPDLLQKVWGLRSGGLDARAFRSGWTLKS